MSFEIKPQPLLKHYVLIRWCCSTHGYFETGTLIFQHSAKCPVPECGQYAGFVESCEGLTTRELPYCTRPRLELEQEAGWQVTNNTGITTRAKSDDSSRRRAGKKATGRPRRDQPKPEPATRYTLEDLNDD